MIGWTEQVDDKGMTFFLHRTGVTVRQRQGRKKPWYIVSVEDADWTSNRYFMTERGAMGAIECFNFHKWRANREDEQKPTSKQEA